MEEDSTDYICLHNDEVTLNNIWLFSSLIDGADGFQARSKHLFGKLIYIDLVDIILSWIFRDR